MSNLEKKMLMALQAAHAALGRISYLVNMEKLPLDRTDYDSFRKVYRQAERVIELAIGESQCPR